MLKCTISRSEINGSFPSPFLSWAADPYYMVYLQCLSPFLSECSQTVPLVTYLLTSIIDTCSIMVVQFTRKEQRQNSVTFWKTGAVSTHPLALNNSSPLLCNISPKVSKCCSTDIVFRQSAFQEAQHRNSINPLRSEKNQVTPRYYSQLRCPSIFVVAIPVTQAIWSPDGQNVSVLVFNKFARIGTF